MIDYIIDLISGRQHEKHREIETQDNDEEQKPGNFEAHHDFADEYQIYDQENIQAILAQMPESELSLLQEMVKNEVEESIYPVEENDDLSKPNVEPLGIEWNDDNIAHRISLILSALTPYLTFNAHDLCSTILIGMAIHGNDNPIIQYKALRAVQYILSSKQTQRRYDHEEPELTAVY